MLKHVTTSTFHHATLLLLTLLLGVGNAYGQTPIQQRMAFYNPDGQLTFSAERGETLWKKTNIAEDGKVRRCTTCHGDDLSQPGKHAKTGKVIDPLAPSANAKRFTKLKKVKKWFKRNCKWTFGRECTTQEKGDLLMYLSQF